MAEKKDPGKFTVRFNIADPQQRTMIELLNQQGRYKAQFLTNAVLHYIHCSETPEIRSMPKTDSKEIERIVRSVLAQQQVPPPHQETCPAVKSVQHLVSQSEDTDRDAIFKTLEAFQQQ